jgi:iron(III) transport system ATP-binding protein
MLMDEPFANLDVRLRDTIRDDTMAMLREAGTATLMVTHDPDEAMRMADHIILMRSGRIVQSGTPDDFNRRPSCRFAATFFRESNTLSGVVRAPGKVETKLGEVTAETAGLAGGTAVDVVVRPEGLRLIPDVPSPAGEVTAARVIGAFGVVDIVVEALAQRLRAYVFAADLPAVGIRVGLALDPAQTFVFPLETP